MNLSEWVDNLEKSGEFKEFKNQHPDAFLIAGFFILDFQGGQNVTQLDYYIPSSQEIAIFSFEEKIESKIFPSQLQDAPAALNKHTNIDVEALWGILTEEMHNRGITEEIRKIIAVVQNSEGEVVWKLNCLLTGMEIVNATIEDSTKSVLRIEKQSLFDILKKMPAPHLEHRPESVSDLKEELKALDKIEKELEKEKEEIEEKLEKAGESESSSEKKA
ncbi:hypothetical protein D6817_01520 [Candidatus Pacearchaeota archaeon]|nr:MAG: hypothetical protein D6817_01520 [Candidatus Pacearchaeota archaeon]